MALLLACKAPELVDAVAGVAGAYYNPTVSNCSGQVPTLIIHGTNDGLISYDGGTRHGAPYKAVERVFSDTAARNGCTTSNISESRSGNTITKRPAFCVAPTELVTVVNGRHTWFDHPPAETLIWNFFQLHG